MSVEYWEMIASLTEVIQEKPTTVANGDGTFTHTFIAADARVPRGLLVACDPVIAHKDGQTFKTLPPSAVLAIQRHEAKRTEGE
jgi:hypothetical protein